MFKRGLLIVFVLILGLLIVGWPVRADELEEIEKQLKDLQRAYELSVSATSPLEKEVTQLKSKLVSLDASIVKADKDLKELEVSIFNREVELGFQMELLEDRVKSWYMHQQLIFPWTVFLESTPASAVQQRAAMYQEAIANRDKDTIIRTGGKIKQLNEDKEKLEKDKVRLAAVKVEVGKQRAFYDQEIAKAKDYQKTLSSQIADLSAKQQEILNARSGGFTASIGDSELADDYNASIKGFRESAPGGSFAVFSFGAHTHRKGMSQYGARGRAQSGQDHKQILKAYYGKEPVSKDTGGSIRVSGHGTMEFETTYLYGIAEMPSSWHAEALKAQAIAARTYAYRYKQEGKEICTTEACQVFNKSKSNNPPDSWKKAVEETRGVVLEDVVTYYASTHGGFASPIGWDTKDGSGGGDFIDKSYDKIGGSPWLYKAWYTKGYSASSDKCGRNNPWLTGEDLADIINAARYRDDRVTPLTTSCYGGNPYSREELRAKSDGPSKVTSVRVVQGNGSTNQVVFQTDKGEITLSGSDFKTAFNIRAPGYLAIPQSGWAFFNIEQK